MARNNILDFIAEAGALKRVKRSGWWMAGVPSGESVAEHSFRTAVIAYVVAKMEKFEPYKAVMMALLGDMPEARINDSHKVAARYLNARETESAVYGEQVKALGRGAWGAELKALRGDYDSQTTPEAVIARDADILECLVQAKEYSDAGFTAAKKFFKTSPGHLRTKSAKKLWKDIKSWDSNEWWEKLGKFER